MLNISSVDIDDPNAIIKYIWAGTNNVASTPTYYEGVQDTSASVETSRGEGAEMRCDVGYDPHDDGILWGIGYLDSDGGIETLYLGGWAPGDRETAEREIAGIVTTMNGGTVAEWQPSPEQAAQIAAIQQRNTEYMAALEGKK